MVSEKLDIREVGQAVGTFKKSTSCHAGWVCGAGRGGCVGQVCSVMCVCGAGAWCGCVCVGRVRGVGATNEASC